VNSLAMVVLESSLRPSFPPIFDVIFVCEDTASAGQHREEMKANYVVTTVKHFENFNRNEKERKRKKEKEMR
jgi:hypothetical protein